jgi:predicted DNA-binding protein (MmcQ/YjbR family)
MNREELRAYCLSLRGTAEEFPFGEGVAVFKVVGKVFALLSTDGSSISLKCDPVRAVMLRDTYPAVTAGYHLNKKHWNSVQLDGSVPDDEVTDMIEHSYQLVVNGLTKVQKQELGRIST